MDTAIGANVAVPHARLDGLDRPVVVFGRHLGGLPWNAVDDQPVHFVFLVLTPREDTGAQLDILSAVARGFEPEATRNELLHCREDGEVGRLARAALRARTPPPTTA